MTTTQALTGAGLKVALDGLGIPPSWFAERMDVTMRTVVRWFDGDSVDPKVAEELEKLSAATLAEMTKMVNKAGDDDPVTLKTYRTDKDYKSAAGWPAEWHRSLTFRVVDHFRAMGRVVNVEYR